MDFISNQTPQIKEMLESMGINSIETLFQHIPQNLMHKAPSIDDGLSEYEGMRLMEEIAAKNTFPQYTNYLGAGAYEHHVPALVQAICSKSEFLTSYTPYQPEISQGMLQAIFEYQSSICALTGMDVSNASMYEGASACAEAILMSLRINNDRNHVAIASSLHPHYRDTITQYLNNHNTQITWIPFHKDGSIDIEYAKSSINTDTAAILLPYPNFFGVIDNLTPIFAHAKTQGTLSIVTANPLVYGLYASAAELGADIAVGDAQPLGLPLQFGGPYLGYLACRQEYVRQLPGRIVGETVDINGKRGFVLTLQAREQHIRREKATSNICTNQALAALASLVCMLWYGPKGLQKLALTNYQRTSYLKDKLSTISCIKTMGSVPIFNEFIIQFSCPIQEVYSHFRHHKIEPGIDLGIYYKEFTGYLLVSVTETKSKAMLDHYVQVAELLAKRTI